MFHVSVLLCSEELPPPVGASGPCRAVPQAWKKGPPAHGGPHLRPYGRKGKLGPDDPYILVSGSSSGGLVA